MILCPICLSKTTADFISNYLFSESCRDDTNIKHSFMWYRGGAYYLVVNIEPYVIEIITDEKGSKIILNSKEIESKRKIDYCESLRYINVYLNLKAFI